MYGRQNEHRFKGFHKKLLHVKCLFWSVLWHILWTSLFVSLMTLEIPGLEWVPNIFKTSYLFSLNLITTSQFIIHFSMLCLLLFFLDYARGQPLALRGHMAEKLLTSGNQGSLQESGSPRSPGSAAVLCEAGTCLPEQGPCLSVTQFLSGPAWEWSC